MTTILTGEIIAGTLRFEDLVPAFIGYLGTIHRGEARLFEKELEAVERIGDDELRAEARDEFLFGLIDAIEARIPEDYYFGTAEGDPACFGVFKINNSDH